MAQRYEIDFMVVKTPSALEVANGVSATIKDLRGASLTVYQAETGSTTVSNPLTVDANGNINGWVDAPDFDVVLGAPVSATINVRRSPRGVFPIESYGGKGDNATDNLTARNDAFTAASAAGGGVVTYGPGIFRHSTAGAVPDNVTVRGAGPNATTIRITSTTAFAFDLTGTNPGGIENLTVDASAAQSAGGGGITTGAGALNIDVDPVWFGNNLHRSIWIKGGAGIMKFTRLRWNGVTGHNTAIEIGDGTNLSTDLYFHGCVGTASTAADMPDWVKVVGGSVSPDTLKMEQCLFITGTRGMTYGSSGAPTNGKLVNVTFDGMSEYGLSVPNCLELECVACEISSCGLTTDVAGLQLQSGIFIFRWLGGTVQGCGRDGVAISAGADDVMIKDASIADNNSSNTASRNGVSLAANENKVQIQGCVIGNGIRLSGGSIGHQKYGIDIPSGTSSELDITGNRFVANETAPMNIANDGTLNWIRGNSPNTVPSVASATTIRNPGTEAALVTGTTTIAGIVAGPDGQRLTLIFQSTPTVTDGANLKLNGNFVATADDTLTLVAFGGNWHEVARSAN